MKLPCLSILLCSIVAAVSAFPNQASVAMLARRETDKVRPGPTRQGPASPIDFKEVRDYVNLNKNPDGSWVQGREAAAMCLKYSIRHILLSTVRRKRKRKVLVDFLEECMKRHNVDWIDIDEETYLELEEASTQYFLKNRNKRGRRLTAKESATKTFGFPPRERDEYNNGNGNGRQVRPPPGPFNFQMPSLEDVGRSMRSYLMPSQRAEVAGSGAPAPVRAPLSRGAGVPGPRR